MIIFENIWWLLVLIGVMINLHELGHFWAARYFGVKVETFSFGFGPKLFSFRRGDTDFRFSAILFGGYVKMAGEQPGDEAAADPQSVLSKPRWQRLIIAFAGPFMNIVLAVGVLTGLYMVKYPEQPASERAGIVGLVLPDSAAAKAGVHEGDRIAMLDGIQNPNWEDITIKEISNANRAMPVTLERGGKEIQTTVTPRLDDRNGVGVAGWAEQSEIQVAGVMEGMDAQKQGLQGGDVLVSVNGLPIRSSYRLREVIKATKGQPIELVYRRDGVQHTATVKPELTEIDGVKSYMIGVQLEPRVTYTKLGFADALVESTRTNIKSAGLIFHFLQGIVERRMSAKSLEGPIGIARLSGDAAREGAVEYFALMSGVSLNLAIFNLLPIPVLDGGVILMLLFEMVLRRDLSLQFKETVMKVGFVFLMAVVVFVLYNDLSKIMPTGG